MRRSLASFDFPAADSFWLLVSAEGPRLVGYAAMARIPKHDARVGFLYIDELHVLSAYWGRGHASRLLDAAASHTATLGLDGLRLLVRAENAAARRLYVRLGFVESGAIYCERLIRP